MISRGELERAHQGLAPLLGWLLRVDADYKALPVRAWGEGWAALNGCDPVAEQVEVVDSVRRIHYANCQEDGDVVVYIVEGMGHQWPGGAPTSPRLMGAPNNEIKATEEMWAFFEGHPLEID
jgi:polyhydroxybutyrate depolymerase